MNTIEHRSSLIPKLKVAGSNPVSRSRKIKDLADSVKSFFVGFFPLHPFLHPFGWRT
jgi:hypothetical protein